MVRGPFTSRFGVIGSRHFETHGPRPHKVLGSGLISVSIAIVALASSAGAAVAGDIAAGEKTFKKCIPCHNIGENAKPSIGPIQNGLKGRKSGTVPGYNYSDANKNSGIVWDEATFKEYIKDPKAKIPGTKMVFPGIKDEKEAEDLWGFLEQFGPDGKKMK
ncbi:MAG: c-type cytochrome [Alphaproteobacteria bacterium]|nr:MAG: c-type cytochrome [Alphaproteobacteria bacterium]